MLRFFPIFLMLIVFVDLVIQVVKTRAAQPWAGRHILQGAFPAEFSKICP